MSKKVMVAMSGGVDSSVAAALLKDQGYEVVGATMKLYHGESEAGGCCSLDDVRDAKRVADILGIPHYTLNLTEKFKKDVIDYFVGEYEKGRTPNPCIACNRYMKFEELLRRTLSLGFDYIATGHYARIKKNLASGRYELYKVPSSKDQSYVLYSLTQKQLAHTLFPLADYSKQQIRAFAKQFNLPVAQKSESQEICFVQSNNYAAFIEEYTGRAAPRGNFVDINGKVLGVHKGITHYTIGQRKGLGLSLGKPVFVVAINKDKNEVVLGEDSDNYKDELVAGDVNFIPFDWPKEPIRAEAKIRYQAKAAPALIIPEGEKVRVKFDCPQRAVTPGQAVVFYDGDLVLGGGTIL